MTSVNVVWDSKFSFFFLLSLKLSKLTYRLYSKYQQTRNINNNSKNPFFIQNKIESRKSCKIFCLQFSSSSDEWIFIYKIKELQLFTKCSIEQSGFQKKRSKQQYFFFYSKENYSRWCRGIRIGSWFISTTPTHRSKKPIVWQWS